MQEAAVSVHDSVAGILSEVISELLILSVLHADGFWSHRSTRRLGARHLEPFEPLMVIPFRGRYG